MYKIHNLLPKFFTTSFLILTTTPAIAQINPDNTLGAEASRLTPNVLINGAIGERVDGGAQRGNNLFHSFSQFNIDNGQRVYFANPSGVENILTRVTGGNVSNIFGTLGVAGNANLFLINPNGILFGQNASLDVRGSFVGTTANAIQFGNQGFFSATNPEAPALLTIQPSALFFNQINQAASIQNNSRATAGKDPAGVDVFGLRVPDGKSLLLIGGNVSMDGGWAIANGGRIELGGLTEAGSIGIQSNGDNFSLSFPDGVQRGDISLNNKAIVGVPGNGDGSIAANARNLEILAGSEFFAGIGSGLGTNNTQAGDITVDATGTITLAGTDSLIFNSVESQATGNAGNITIKTGSLEVTGGAQIDSFTRGRGNAGNITIQAKNAVTFDGVGNNGFPSASFSDVQPGAVGDGGNINITAGSLSLINGGELGVSVREAFDKLPGGQGTGGTVDINVRDTLTISGTESGIFASLGTSAIGRAGNIKVQTGNLFIKDGQIISSTLGNGDSGNISIKANDTISLDIGGIYTNVQSRDAVGKAGTIDITTGSLSLTNGAEINSFTRGQGSAGNITIQARDTITLDGFDSNGNDSALSSNVLAGAIGNGGNINITASSLLLTNGGELRASINGASNTLPGGQGIGGTVDINVRDALTISGTGSRIFGSLGTSAVGRAGDIKVQAGNLFIKEGGQIISSTFGQGDAGNISITANDAISLDSKSYILTNVQIRDAVGNAGKIDIATGSLSLTNGAEINSFTRGQGNAGNITIQARDTVTFDGKDSDGNKSGLFSVVGNDAIGNGGTVNITSASLSLKNGGTIGLYVSDASDTFQGKKAIGGTANINVSNAFTISGEGSGIFASLGSDVVGTGGDVNIKAGNISIQDAGEISSNNYGKGNAGSIDITTGSLNIANRAGIFAGTFGQGNAGNITVEAKDLVEILSDSNLDSGVAQSARGNTGDVTITTARLIVRNSQIGFGVFGEGNGGNFKIIASDSVELSGQVLKREGDTSIGGSVGFPGGLFAQIDLTGKGRAGNLSVETRRLSVSDGSKIQAATFGDGDAGNVFIRADEIDLFETETPNFFNTGIFAGVQTDAKFEAGLINPRGGRPPKGNGGNLTIETRKLSVRDGAEVFAQTTGEGDAGKIFIRASESVNVRGISTGTLERPRTSKITASATQRSTGNGGSLTIATPLLNIANGGFISSSSEGRGTAGDINITGDITRLNNGRIIAQTASTDGGNINLNLSQYLLLDNNSQISTTAGTAQAGGNGGNINIQTEFIVAQPNQNSDITANAFDGSGGTVNINATSIFGIVPLSAIQLQSLRPNDLNPANLPTNDITAISQTNPNLSGSVTVNSPEVDPSRALIQLPTNLVDASTQITSACIPKNRRSSFAATGRSGLPFDPTRPLEDNRTINEWVRTPTTSQIAAQAVEIATPQNPPTQLVVHEVWRSHSPRLD